MSAFTKISKFYEIVNFNNDVFEIDPLLATNKLASIFFRIDTEEVQHTRKVYQLMDILGELGGLNSALTAMVMVVFGSYLTFSSDINYMTYMYSDQAFYNQLVIGK